MLSIFSSTGNCFEPIPEAFENDIINRPKINMSCRVISLFFYFNQLLKFRETLQQTGKFKFILFSPQTA